MVQNPSNWGLPLSEALMVKSTVVSSLKTVFVEIHPVLGSITNLLSVDTMEYVIWPLGLSAPSLSVASTLKNLVPICDPASNSGL